MQREFPNLCINSSQFNQAVLGRQILGSNLECLNVICAKSPDLIGTEKRTLQSPALRNLNVAADQKLRFAFDKT